MLELNAILFVLALLILEQTAMTNRECLAALELGKNSADLAKAKDADIFIV